jgi:thiosulfate dehydrogenase (quinone) large subunit
MWAELERRDERLAYALLRAALGMNLLMHGVGRMLTGPGDFAFKLQAQFSQAPLPAWSVHTFGVLLPGVEAILGTLVLAGLRTKAALVAAALLMVALTFGAGLIEDWTAAATELMYAAIIAALIATLRFNRWSVDSWLVKKDDEHAMVP